MFRIKICGITRPEDAILAAESGADAIGINFYAGSKRFVELKSAKKIAATTPPDVAKVGVFVNESAERIRALFQQVPLDYVQLHGDESPEFLRELAATPVIKVFRTRKVGRTPITNFLAACGLDNPPIAVLVDAFDPDEFGGTGRCLDWSAVGEEKLPLGDVPLLLAGGLNADNVAQAIRLARPFGVDVASGVESSPGVKDETALRLFVERARKALDECG